MDNKKSKGRQKIPMKKIENKDDLYASFSKRRAGLYKKASEIVKECNVDIGIIISSPTGKPFSFFHPNADAVASRFLNPQQVSGTTQLVAAHARSRVNQLNSRLDELETIKDIAIASNDMYDSVMETRPRGRWESIEELNEEEVTKFEAWLNDVGSNMQNRLNQLENGASSSK